MNAKLTLITTHLVGNALLLYLGYYWLGLGESDALHLAFSAAVILFFALAALWLHGTSLVLFANAESFAAAAKRALRNVLPLFALSLIVLGIYLLLDHWYDSFGHQAFVIGSYGTMKIRRPVEPTNVLKTFHALIWILRWLIVPALAWPIATQIANQGWSGFRPKINRSPLYWLKTAALMLVAIYLPLHLFFWIPQPSSFTVQVISVIFRLGLGYLLFTAALLASEFVTSTGNPRDTQPSTVVSP